MKYLLLTVLLALISVSDFKQRKIPNRLLGALLLLWLLFLVLNSFLSGVDVSFTPVRIAAFPEEVSDAVLLKGAWAAVFREGVSAAAILEGVSDAVFREGLKDVLRAFSVSVGVFTVSQLSSKVLRKGALAPGDVKLIFAVSLFLNFDQCLYMLFFSAVSGLLLFLVMKKKRDAGCRKSGILNYPNTDFGNADSLSLPFSDCGKYIPFGQAISMGTLLALLLIH